MNDGIKTILVIAVLVVCWVAVDSYESKGTESEPEPPKLRAKWEHVYTEPMFVGAGLDRTRTPGGWIVERDKRLVYVPDPRHEWLAPVVEKEGSE